ncbi:MAG TPA: fimbria/pilus periplasmic chaperone [Buttiauxella sp.]
MTGLMGLSLMAHAAIAVDRTRVVFPGNQSSVSLNITNENLKLPFLAQSWLEDEQGKKLSSPFSVMPPLQRVESGKKSIIRINAGPEIKKLPQERESVFWLNVREIPPKSEKANVMQVALQTRIKLFYRPAGVLSAKGEQQNKKLILHKIANGFRIENPTPFYQTVISITGGKQERVARSFRSVMVAPESSATVTSRNFATPWVTTINDYGGRPIIAFNCQGDVCHAVDRAA